MCPQVLRQLQHSCCRPPGCSRPSLRSSSSSSSPVLQAERSQQLAAQLACTGRSRCASASAAYTLEALHVTCVNKLLPLRPQGQRTELAGCSRQRCSHLAASSGTDADSDEDNTAKKLAAPIGLALGVAVLLGGGWYFKGQIRGFVDYFIGIVDDLGPLGCGADRAAVCTAMGQLMSAW